MISRYVVREVMKPSLAVCGLLAALFAGYCWITFLDKAVNAILPSRILLTLIALKVGIALEVLLPVSLYFGVILGLGRLYADSEIKAFMACGISPFRVLSTIVMLAGLVAIVVGGLSLFLRPLAYAQSYLLKAQAEEGLSVENLDAGHFYERREGTLVFFAEEVDPQTNRLHRVFVQSSHNDKLRIITAREAEDTIDPTSGMSIPMLYDGFEYQLAREGDITHISKFSRMAIYPQDAILDYKRKAASTETLWFSDSRKDIAELQWRFSTPFSTILLGILGVPLSRSLPRQGKYAKIFTATVLFAVFYFLGLMAKALVEKGTLPLIPGVWWIVIGLTILVGLFLYPSRINRRQAGNLL